MNVASANHAVALKAWGQKKRLFISFSLINEANEKKVSFSEKSNTMEAFKKPKKVFRL